MSTSSDLKYKFSFCLKGFELNCLIEWKLKEFHCQRHDHVSQTIIFSMLFHFKDKRQDDLSGILVFFWFHKNAMCSFVFHKHTRQVFLCSLYCVISMSLFICFEQERDRTLVLMLSRLRAFLTLKLEFQGRF